MKKIFFITILAVIGLNAKSQMQPPNGGFENWVAIDTSLNPVGWSSFNNFSSYGVPIMSFRTTDSHSGSYALRLTSDTATIPPPLGTNVLDTLAGYVFLGIADMNNPGISYTDRPTSMEAYVKGTLALNGNAFIVAGLRKWNTVSHARDQVAQAVFYMDSSIVHYKQISVPFNYSLPDIPDTLEIKIMAGNVGPGGIIMPGNEFFVDDISFTTVTGINEAGKDNPNVRIYPNPAINNITIECQQQATVEITSIQGQLIENLATNGNKTSIDVSAFTEGVYVVQVKTEKGVTVKKFVKE